jgi:mannose-6-phosphate isomerase-like protein (cupin superfamily)
MRKRAFFMFAILLAGLGVVAPVQAQKAAEPDRPYVSGAELTAMIDKIAADIAAGKPGDGANLLKSGPYATHLEYRTAVHGGAIHERDSELFYVLEGSGTLMLGGKLVDPKRANPTNINGSRVEGGTARKVSKGDTFIVPAGTPHWFSAIDGRLVMTSMRLPVPASP